MTIPGRSISSLSAQSPNWGELSAFTEDHRHSSVEGGGGGWLIMNATDSKPPPDSEFEHFYESITILIAFKSIPL